MNVFLACFVICTRKSERGVLVNFSCLFSTVDRSAAEYKRIVIVRLCHGPEVGTVAEWLLSN